MYTNYPHFDVPEIPYIILSNTYVSYYDGLVIVDSSYKPRQNGLSAPFTKHVQNIIKNVFYSFLFISIIYFSVSMPKRLEQELSLLSKKTWHKLLSSLNNSNPELTNDSKFIYHIIYY